MNLLTKADENFCVLAEQRARNVILSDYIILISPRPIIFTNHQEKAATGSFRPERQHQNISSITLKKQVGRED